MDEKGIRERERRIREHYIHYLDAKSIRKLAAHYLKFKKALDAMFDVPAAPGKPGVLEVARRLEKRRVGRPKKADETAYEFVRDLVIEQYRKDGKSVAFIAERLGKSDRYVNKCLAAKRRCPRTKLK